MARSLPMPTGRDAHTNALGAPGPTRSAQRTRTVEAALQYERLPDAGQQDGGAEEEDTGERSDG